MQQYRWQYLAATCHYILVEENVVPRRSCAAGDFVGERYENSAAKRIGKMYQQYAGCNKRGEAQYVIAVPYLKYAVDVYEICYLHFGG